MTSELRLRIFKDPVSAATHFAGFLLALGATATLVALAGPERPRVAAMAIYGATLVTLFGASSLYHFLDLGERGNRWLRRLDHAAIFLLIAGTYVPPLSLLLDGAWLIGGGAAYTLGAAVYARGWPDPWPGRIGHHEIWHCFVLAGAGAHFAFVCTLLDAPPPPL
jgi:predicted membrane channel-forming protein YqfA (hemolysin III family)